MSDYNLEFEGLILKDLRSQGYEGKELQEKLEEYKGFVKQAIDLLKAETMLQPKIDVGLDEYFESLEEEDEDA